MSPLCAPCESATATEPTPTHLTSVSMTDKTNRRRRWSASENVQMVKETFEPGMTASPDGSLSWRRHEPVMPRAKKNCGCRHRLQSGISFFKFKLRIERNLLS
jgi:hypothetical protein